MRIKRTCFLFLLFLASAFVPKRFDLTLTNHPSVTSCCFPSDFTWPWPVFSLRQGAGVNRKGHCMASSKPSRFSSTLFPFILSTCLTPKKYSLQRRCGSPKESDRSFAVLTVYPHFCSLANTRPRFDLQSGPNWNLKPTKPQSMRWNGKLTSILMPEEENIHHTCVIHRSQSVNQCFKGLGLLGLGPWVLGLESSLES